MPDFVSHPWINPGTIEKRAYQDAIVKTCLTGNTLVVVPTGLGKTSIAAIVAAERLHRAFELSKNKPAQPAGFVSADSYSPHRDAKALLLAPTRPLVEQHKKSFDKFLKIGPDEIKAVTGESSPGERKRLYEKADVVIATPQTIRNDIENRTLDLSAFCLLVVDEAHRSVGNYAYVSIAKAYMDEALDPLVLALTASPGGFKSKIDEIRKQLFIKNVEIRSREDADVAPYVQKLNRVFVEVDFPADLSVVRSYLDRYRAEQLGKLAAWNLPVSPRMSKKQIIIMQQKLARQKSGFAFQAMSVLAELLKLDHAALLLETQCLYAFEKYAERLKEDATRATARLLNNPHWIKSMEAVKKLIESGKENPKMEKLKQLVSNELKTKKKAIVFTQYRDTVDAIVKTLAKMEGLRPVAFIGQAKKSGSGMSQKEQKAILDEFKLGTHNVLVATSIGEEGLDIEETDAVIFYEPIPSEIRNIQRAGRTARTKPGKVFFLIARGTRDEAFYWAGHHKEAKMKSILQAMQQKNPLNLTSYWDEKTKKQ
jgi:Fanconi anemia group M protein